MRRPALPAAKLVDAAHWIEVRATLAYPFGPTTDTLSCSRYRLAPIASAHFGHHTAPDPRPPLLLLGERRGGPPTG
jgi:hypothetical protein